METQSHLYDLDRTMKVLESCKTREHIKGAVNYFELFINKWSHLLSDKVIRDLRLDFEIDSSLKLINIEKGLV